MTAQNSVNNPASVSAGEGYTTGSVTSNDGTTISYRQLGHGPGVVMLHGAMESAQSHMQLAAALADSFTVYLPGRRGRGLSVSNSREYSIQKEVEDLDALLIATDAHNVFGVSAGGLIVLQAALTLPAIRKAAVYEPALTMNKPKPAAVLARFDAEMAQDKVAAALITGMKGGEMGPAIFNIMPRWLLESFTSQAMASEDKTAKDSDITMRKLAPSLHYDFALVAEMGGEQERFRGVQAEVVLLGGSKSPAYLKTALGVLEKILPHIQRVEFSGLDHGGSSDLSATNRNGQPARVAQELRRFFA